MISRGLEEIDPLCNFDLYNRASYRGDKFNISRIRTEIRNPIPLFPDFASISLIVTYFSPSGISIRYERLKN